MSSPKEREIIDSLVFNFRRAIEVAKDNNELGEFFRKFPNGQCGHTSDILAQFLIDNGIGPVEYVNGTYYGVDFDDKWCHTWLVVEDLIIDIAGDQFKYHKEPLKNNTPVYIGPMTKFYQLFKVDPAGIYEHFGLDKQWVNYEELIRWYDTILEYLK